MAQDIDFVITELTVDITTSTNIGRASFIFIDQSPHFPKVSSTLDQIKERDDAFVTNYSIATTEITENTDLTGLEYVKH
tara:strand:- start:511 stop:747 length:237 start_codon:yes stop_codon:yes gene_type:complete